MKIDKIENSMLAPCGMNCMVCYRFCNSKKRCDGCINNSKYKPKSCVNCKIKNCVNDNKLKHCFECEAFPCKLIKNLEKSYKRYNVSLIQNSQQARQYGIEKFLESEAELWRCPHCGGVISLHDAQCSECGYTILNG